MARDLCLCSECLHPVDAASLRCRHCGAPFAGPHRCARLELAAVEFASLDDDLLRERAVGMHFGLRPLRPREH